jgi:hypothetical protein
MEGEGREGYDMTCEAEINGKRAEEMAAEICLSLGYSVTHSASQNSTWDLIVNGLRVQVKKRTIGHWTRSSIEMKTSARGTGIAYKAGEVDVFAIVISGSWYVVPSGAISRDDGSVPNDIRIVSIYPFIDAWHLLNGAKHMSERQLGFDF